MIFFVIFLQFCGFGDDMDCMRICIGDITCFLFRLRNLLYLWSNLINFPLGARGEGRNIRLNCGPSDPPLGPLPITLGLLSDNRQQSLFV